ncbi:hypothetical protein DKM44_09105 [Deinococcus irradiatisoli]|uniref:Uncharacterized protein n=1 Tax=Deinococcus irradiatisoli TaxID=2202254 RepID=A0A2Z3JDX3_9DEIO|nr:hypothetical protein [Deinococcus irradiatisoli]AWN23367.1 hypothetical protein DKM44_09105 [Deinococcus irradiatisoli]
MEDAKPNASSENRQAESQMEENFKPQTVPDQKSDGYWDATSDQGTQVSSQDTPQTPAPAPEASQVPADGNTYGSLKDGNLPSGATTDPGGQAGTPKLGED